MSKKEDILKVAAQHFSKFGYSGVSLDSIAKEVGITKAAIYYHFKDKANLYEGVLLFRLENLVKFIEKKITSKDPQNRLKEYIEGFGEFLQNYPCFAAILAHEFADNGKNMSDKAVKELSKTLNLLTSILNDGIKKDIFEISNPMVVQMMIVSTLIMHQTTKNLRKRVTDFIEGYEILPEPDIKDISKIVAKKILKAIEHFEKL
ncbi:TetR/AcrR family transcriptional regulator [Nitrosophilus kaiyonis]|uniref:TetR/AcrR family transcriptional regulator n=1 Tax=Nitrosophilus kaiyonis TaxID=2930200 RepID=UPI0024902667|nr:TetR/AcrR family transcriptional regulator [Nitrosophilus kaiyonis]